MKENIEQRVIGLFVLMLGILAFVAVSAVRNIQQSIKDSDWVNHTHAVIIDVSEVLSYLHAGDSALRNYVLTGDKRDQGAYRGAYSTMVERLDDAKALTRSGAEEAGIQLQIVGLQNLISNRIDIARSIVKAREQGGLEAARRLFLTNPDLDSMVTIERAANRLVGDENKLLTARDKAEHLQAQGTKLSVYSGVAVNFMLLAFVFWLLRDDLKARRQAAKALEDANAQLEAKVQERTAELVKANQALKQENLERRWSYQALEHQMRYNQLIINSIVEMVFVVSRALNISRVNPAVVHQTSWNPQDLVAHSIERVLQLPLETEAGAPQNPLIIAMRDGREIQEQPAVLISRSGKTTPVQYSLIPLHDQDKVVGGVVTVRPRNGASPEHQQ
jgi:CHASE3 domain sensor protein